jgi:hypothetical protein
MTLRLASAAFGVFLGLSGMAQAQGDAGVAEQGVVVELFTSQGCSSCPPADELMGQLAGMPGVIALSLHVDYWDYIGWTDTLASPQFTERQKSYAHAAGDNMIYTPQMIVAGRDRVEGNRPGEVAASIAQQRDVASPVSLTMARNGGDLVIHAETSAPLPQGAVVQLVQYVPQKVVDIGLGENAGRTVTYHNVVTSWKKIGDWSGAGALDLTAAAADGPVVVIIQTVGAKAILAAARLR